jgi:mannose/fructose-specific phosphotransferase system component IIA
MSEGPRAILAGHGDFASGLLSAVAQIIGTADAFIPVSNRDLSAADVERVMRAEADRYDVRVVFTDLPAGSCTMAARRLQRERPDMLVVTGTNLATLLDFAFHGDLSDSEAIHHAVDKGRASLVVSGVPGGR